MLETNDKQLKVTDRSFDEYMMYSLESSENYSMKMHERSQQAINYYLGLFTALVGGGVVVLTTVTATAEPLKSLILTFDLAIIVGVGTLTYLWILVSIGNTRQEDCVQFFLHQRHV